MHKSLFLTSLLWLTATTTVFAGGVVFYSVFPNTIDDTNLEYIEISNTSCAAISLAGHTLRDAAGTSYTLASETLPVWAVKRFSRVDTRIALNNTDEILYLIDPLWVVIDSENYSTSVKGVPITFVVSPELNCNVATTTEETTTTTTTTVSENSSTGSTDTSTQTGVITSTGWLIGTGSTTGTGGSILGVESGGSGSTNSLTGSIILVGTGTTSTGSVTTNSWALLGSWSTVSNTGTLIVSVVNSGSLVAPIPLLLKILDLDNNGRIDRLIVDYSNTLTGSLRLDKFILFSATGGLATRRIDTGSWVVRALSYSGSELLVDLYEQDIARTDLRINTTTESHLRLKTLADFGLTSLGGTPTEPITLTESFGRYKSDYILNLALPATVPIVSTNPSVIVQLTNPTPVSPVTSITPVIPPSLETVTLPTPVPIFLSSVSISIQSGILSNGACKTSTCGINLRATWTLSWDICTWQIQPTKWRATSMKSCNPRTFSLGSGGGVVTLLVSRNWWVREDRTVFIGAYSKPIKISNTRDDMIIDEPLSTSISAENLTFAVNDDENKISTTSTSSINTIQKVPKKNIKKPPVKKPPAKKKADQKSVTSTTKKTTKTVKTPAPPKSIEKPQKNGLSTPSDPNTSIAIWVVGLICSALGFGVAIYRRPKASTLP